MIMIGAGHVVPVQSPEIARQVRGQSDKLNSAFLEMSRGDGDLAYLSSPVSAAGHAVNRFQQLFLLSVKRGGKEPANWAQFAWDILNAQGQKLLKDGQALATAQENIAELTRQAEEFNLKQMPVMKALQII
jgi:hypothetical protein